MRILATGAAALAASAAPRRAGRAGFSVAEAEESRTAAPATGPRAVASLDALIALQGVEDPTERRRRAVRRGRTALDLLEAIKVAVLAGDLDPAALARLKVAAAGLAEPCGDAGLDAVLAQIELRAAVELAKFGQG